MAAWDQIAQGNLKAAQVLGDAAEFRSCASRAYYAAFSAVVHLLRSHGPFGKGREAPPHHAVPSLIEKRLKGRMSPGKLRAVKAMIRSLYNERIAADYRSDLTIDARAALQSRRDATAVCRDWGCRMHDVLDPVERDKIVNLAKKYLDRHQPTDYRLVIVPDAIQRDDDWYYVVVEPSRNDIRSYDYSARLAEAELELQERENVNVLLVPALPN